MNTEKIMTDFSPLPDPDGINLWEGGEQKFEMNNNDNEELKYRAWKGQKIKGDFAAIDTETVAIDKERMSRIIPQLVITQASGKGLDENFIVHPDDLADFIKIHKEKDLVFFNIAFDLPVMDKALRDKGMDVAADMLWSMADGGQCHDVMLLDQLVRIGEGGAHSHRRSLADAAEDLLGFELEKEDTPRLHYETLIRKKYRGIAARFFQYAMRDSRATLECFEMLWDKGWDMHRKLQERSSEFEDEKASLWAPLTEQIQVRAALALGNMSWRGIRTDNGRLQEVYCEALKRLKKAAKEFGSDPKVREFEEKSGGILRRDGNSELEFTRKNSPRKRLTKVRKLFRRLCSEYGEEAPRTDKNLIATSRDAYTGMKVIKEEPAFEKYFRLQELALNVNKPEAILEHVGEDGRIHPSYTALEKTGRTSSSRPQIQNLPREGTLRACLIPGPGCVFYGADYSSIELVALAAICRHRYGFSKLGDKIAEGVDTHSFTAAEVLGKHISEVTREERQSAKIINFGVPGGMGAAALSHNAKASYDLDMSEAEAEEWKQKLITEIYPEIGFFLNDWLEKFISVETGLPVKQIVDYLIEATEADGFSSDAEKWILSSLKNVLYDGTKSDGQLYSAAWVDKLWSGLSRVVAGAPFATAGMKEAVWQRRIGPQTADIFFPTRAATLTGRIQGGVNFRQGHNSQFQGLAADGLKLAIYRMMREGYRPVLEIHDEVIVEVPEDCNREKTADAIDQILIEEMQRVIGDQIPVAVEGRFMERLEK